MMVLVGEVLGELKQTTPMAADGYKDVAKPKNG